MATYMERRENSKERKIQELLLTLPDYMTQYNDYISKLSPLTRYYYLFDISGLMTYYLASDNTLREYSLKEFPISYWTAINRDSIETYIEAIKTRDRNTLKTIDASTGYKVRKYSSYRSFFKFLLDNGFVTTMPDLDYTLPPKKKNNKELAETDIKTLLAGIEKNTSFLIHGATEKGDIIRSVVSITEDIAEKRERQLLRNSCIMNILIYGGLTVSEIASLNLDSLKDTGIEYEKINGETGFVTYTPQVKSSLDLYLSGIEIPQELIDAQSVPTFEAMWNFAMKNNLKSSKRYIRKEAVEAFGIADKDFLEDIYTTCHYARMSGRKAFSPPPEEKALFLTNFRAHPGQRMSVRMIEDMVLEMTRTYIPEAAEKKNYNPNELKGIGKIL